MKLKIFAAALAALSLCACNTLNPVAAGQTSAGEKVLDNLKDCKRHYTGAIGAGVTGSFDIQCEGTAVKPAS